MGCVCGGKCWMVVVSSMAVMTLTMVMTKQELVVAPVEAMVMVLVSCGDVGMDVIDCVAGEVRMRVSRRWRPRLEVHGQRWWRPWVARGVRAEVEVEAVRYVYCVGCYLLLSNLVHVIY